MTILPADYENLLYICERLRTQDRLEVFATRWDDDPAQLATQLFYGDGLIWCLGTDDREPTFLVGAMELWPGMWAPWAMGTRRTHQIALAATRLVCKEMIPQMKAKGFRRAECRAAIKNTIACEWLERLGGIRESVNERMGREGETFVTYVFYPECAGVVHV